VERMVGIGEHFVNYHESETNRGVNADLAIRERNRSNAGPLARHRSEHQAPESGSRDTHPDLVVRELDRLRNPPSPPTPPRAPVRSRRRTGSPQPAVPGHSAPDPRREQRLREAEERLQSLAHILAERDATLSRLLPGLRGNPALLTEAARQEIWRDAMH